MSIEKDEMRDAEYDSNESGFEDGDDLVAVLGDDDEVMDVMTADDFDDEEPPAFDEKFGKNLALDMEPSDRAEMAMDIMELVKADEESRQEWNERLVDGLAIIGIMDVPEDKLPFPRATRINHPILAEVMTQFQARAVEELFPSGGPAKGVVLGDEDDELTEQAERVAGYMNYHLTEQDADYFADTDQMLYYLPYDGSVFRKVYYDYLLGFPIARYIKSADFIVPYDARSLRDAPRYTHRMPGWSINDIRKLQERGVFADYDISDEVVPAAPEEGSDELEDISDKREPTSVREADTLTLHEVTIDLDPDEYDPEFAGTGYKLPYIVLIDNENNEVLSIRRNWKEEDDEHKKRIWVAHYKYLPGLGFYGWGILHVIGSLGASASGVVRAMLDSALRNNAGGGWVSKDLNTRGKFEIEPGVWKEVNASAEELAKGLIDYPSPNLSGLPALVQLLEIILDGCRSFSSMTETLIGEASNTGPVGTTVALIEQSMKVMSAIHKRMHMSLRQELKMMSALIHETMPEEYPYRVEGDAQTLLREDFDDRIDVVPVSDPNIFSSTQRMAIAQALYQMVSEDQTGVFDEKSAYEAAKRLLQAMRVPEIDKILPDKEAKRLDPVSENQNLLVGKPMRAFIDQNHMAHITTHRAFLEQLQAGDPETLNRVLPVAIAHIAQHEAFAYRLDIQQRILQMTGGMLPAFDMNERQQQELPPEVENQIAEAAAIASQQIAQELVQQQQQQMQQEQQAEQQAQAQEFESEQARKDAEFERDQARKDAALGADQQRQAQAAAANDESMTMKNIMDMVTGLKKKPGGESRAKS